MLVNKLKEELSHLPFTSLLSRQVSFTAMATGEAGTLQKGFVVLVHLSELPEGMGQSVRT